MYKKSKRYVIVDKQNHVQNMECNINWVQKEKARWRIINIKEINERLEYLKIIKVKAEKSLSGAPEGKLVLARSANTIQYQQKQKDGTRVYIKKSNAALIKALAQKEYDQKILKTIDAEERRIRKFLNKYNPNSLLEVYDSMPEQKGIFVTKYELTDEEYAKMWEESKNNLGRIEPDEQLKELGLITEKGNMSGLNQRR